MERLNKLPKVTQLERGRARTQAQVGLPQKPCFLTPWLDPKRQFLIYS